MNFTNTSTVKKKIFLATAIILSVFATSVAPAGATVARNRVVFDNPSAVSDIAEGINEWRRLNNLPPIDLRSMPTIWREYNHCLHDLNLDRELGLVNQRVGHLGKGESCGRTQAEWTPLLPRIDGSQGIVIGAPNTAEILLANSYGTGTNASVVNHWYQSLGHRQSILGDFDFMYISTAFYPSSNTTANNWDNGQIFMQVQFGNDTDKGFNNKADSGFGISAANEISPGGRMYALGDFYSDFSPFSVLAGHRQATTQAPAPAPVTTTTQTPTTGTGLAPSISTAIIVDPTTSSNNIEVETSSIIISRESSISSSNSLILRDSAPINGWLSSLWFGWLLRWANLRATLR